MATNLLTSTKLYLKHTRSLIGKSISSRISDELSETSVSRLLDDAVSFRDVDSTAWATTPYPTNSLPAPEVNTPQKVDPTERSVILFSGQGLLRVGHVKEYLKFPRARELFAIANDILGYDLLNICLKGPQSLLNRTEFNQPATVVTSLAGLVKLQEERPGALESCIAVAGYSVGELTALIFAGAIPYEEGLRLISVRATAMQVASEITPQGMLSCFCLPTAKVSAICQKAEKWALDIGLSNPICSVAIYQYTQGKVFGGCNEALEYIKINSEKFSLCRLQKLPVNGAFHTTLMEPALKPFIKALNKTPFEQPNTCVYSNYSATPYTQNKKLNEKFLIRQIISPVKWEQIMHKIYERPVGTEFPQSFDVGSRGTLKTILKMINTKATDSCYVY